MLLGVAVVLFGAERIGLIDEVDYAGLFGGSLGSNTEPDVGTAGVSVPAGDLRAELHLAAKEGHRRLRYGDVYRHLRDLDENPDRRSHVLLLYSGRSVAKDDWEREYKTSGGQGHPDSWNREHVWPKSRGFPDIDDMPHNDLHHIRATDKSVNADRRSLDFDISEDRLAEAPNARIDDDSFEPPDRVKGDIARMLFYVDVRYEGGDGVPDLRLIDRASHWSEPTLGKLCTLLTWHAEDPVDGLERRRNDLVADIQGNRNPFIDDPEAADALYGPQC